MDTSENEIASLEKEVLASKSAILSYTATQFFVNDPAHDQLKEHLNDVKVAILDLEFKIEKMSRPRSRSAPTPKRSLDGKPPTSASEDERQRSVTVALTLTSAESAPESQNALVLDSAGAGDNLVENFRRLCSLPSNEPSLPVLGALTTVLLFTGFLAFKIFRCYRRKRESEEPHRHDIENPERVGAVT